MGQPAPTVREDWYEGMDARIKQLPSLMDDPALVAAKEAAAAEVQAGKFTMEDYKFIAFMFLVAGGIAAGVIAVGGTILWFTMLREGAPFAVRHPILFR